MTPFLRSFPKKQGQFYHEGYYILKNWLILASVVLNELLKLQAQNISDQKASLNDGGASTSQSKGWGPNIAWFYRLRHMRCAIAHACLWTCLKH